MKTEQSNLLNSLTLITVGLWGYFDVSDYDLSVITSFEHWTALIPVVFGFVLLLCHKGVKNNSKLVAHIAVVVTLLIFIALVGKRLPISIEQGGAGLFRVIAMSLTSFLAMITFVKSFISNRKKS
jgi:Na+/citrate or Na+/malate symporter|tara:strand:- start:11799 stop:12173 length:375 start_codon:yes stop_codon:yes gene_type:complete